MTGGERHFLQWRTSWLCPLLHHLLPRAAPPFLFLSLGLTVFQEDESLSAMAGLNTGYLLVGLVVLVHTWRGWAKVEVNMEDRLEVFLGTAAPITCMFTSDEGIGGTVIKWFYVTQSGERKEIYYQDSFVKEIRRGTYFDRISVKDLSATGQVTLTINRVELDDEREFICEVANLMDKIAEGRTKLSVFDAPDPPTIEGVQTVISVNEENPSKIGVCEVKNGFPKPNITWYKNDMPLQAVQGEVQIVPSTTYGTSHLISVSSELSMKVTKEDNMAFFYCEVNYFVPGATKMTETNRINITVHYPSTEVEVWVESPKGKIKEGDSIELRCHGNGNHESELTISHNDEEYSLDGNVLVLHNVTRQSSGEYTCNSLNLITSDMISGNTQVFVHYLDPVVIEPKHTVEVGQGEKLQATCNALSSLNTSTTWFKNQEVVFKGHTLIQEDASFDTAGTYTCVVTVPEIDRMETSGTLHVRVTGPPEIVEEVNTDIEKSFESTVELTCSVRGFPVPSITWTTSDGKVSAVSQTETEEGVRSVVNIKVTSDITVFCNASNKYGDDALVFNIKATKHTTTTTTTSTTTTTTTTTAAASGSSSITTSADSATIFSPTVKAETAIPPKNLRKEGSGVVIAVIIICILLLAILGSVLYFLYKTGKICGRSGKQDLTKEMSNKDNIVVEMKSDNTEEAVLLGVNGEKQSSDQK